MTSSPKPVRMTHPARGRERNVEADQVAMFRSQGWVEKAPAKEPKQQQSDKD